MPQLRFEWDVENDVENQRKHGVSFAEAEGVFSDPHGRFRNDPDHSDDEDRFLLLGLSANLRTLVVCHCYRRGGDVIRIISARKANASERNQYGRRWKK